MEVEMMKERIDLLVGIAMRAKGTPVYEPRFLAQINTQIHDNDRADFYNALAKELPFTTNHMPLSDAEIGHAHGLFQWLASQLLETSNAPLNSPLIQVLQIASALDLGAGQLWKELASVGPLRRERLQDIRQLLLSGKIEIRESRHVGQVAKIFKDGCNNYDWQSIDSVLHHILGFYDSPISRAARALSIFAPSDLEYALGKMQDVITIIALIESLEPIKEFKMLGAAASSANWALKFFALRLSLEHKKSGVEHELESAWEELLIQAAQNNQEWPKWAAVFNTFPSRYPGLQRAMGRALCTMSHEAVAQYFNAIRMSTASRREDLANVFKTVQRHNDEAQRKLIWKLAYNRWKAWDFDMDDPNRRLFSIQTSPLDLAITAYYLECLDRDERSAYEDELRTEFYIINSAWYEEISDYISALNRHLSRYQPLGHAQHNLCSDDEWGKGRHWYSPDWLPRHPYWDQRYRRF
ncbi:hypothetical protein [Pseudomonas putida]|uniref:hypothetical protein n=1 Tax=Pseudomonas putida TaxID=303 RepID=UPI002363D917|nr:hypothetical protein [Pseudomonas putida]MDD1990023.1 hypothetical protein [Pseudomonas putida]HDS1796692.1 hypothetical protein [Pseudomonas putida]